ncbi:MAG TPA: ATP-grasp domain-containing protein [Firmicutes bacterium]|nr:ATP-grasp domain-containing protein [Bacillota bacterium]
MKFEQHDFLPVLLGGDISNYSMARSFYEAYRVKSIVAGKHPIYPTTDTALIQGYYNEDIENGTVFIRMMEEIDRQHPGSKKIILGNNDNYVRLAIENREHLSGNFFVPYIEQKLYDRLVVKEEFYKLCAEYGLDHPGTYIFDCSKGAQTDIDLPFPFPVFVKPSDTVLYSRYVFPGKKKGYFITGRQELQKVLASVCTSGYAGTLIIQEYIPGDDTAMRVLTCYSDRNGKVKGAALGHILLEDHAPMLVGNYTAILSENNTALCDRFIPFLEALQIVGITHFDIKYDARDGKYKVLELNIRQGRNNYYTTGSGLNLAACLVRDYIEEQELPLTFADKQCVCAIVPRFLVRKYVRDPELVARIKQARWIRPLLMPGDLNFPRLKKHFINDLKQISNYSKYYHPAER